MFTPVSQNPFLDSTVNQAGNDATRMYMQALDDLLQAGQPLDWLFRMQQFSSEELDKIWTGALESATAGNVQGGISLLVQFFTEWARYKALQYLIDAEQACVLLDLRDSLTYDMVRKDFQQTSGSQAVYLATQLHNALLAGQTLREQERQSSIVQNYTALHDYTWQLIGRQDTRLDQAHQVNQQYAESAYQGVKLAQQSVYMMQEGVGHMYQFVQGHGTNMVSGMQALQNHLEQSLPSYIESAQRKRIPMIVWVFGIGLVMIGLFALACLIGTHL